MRCYNLRDCEYRMQLYIDPYNIYIFAGEKIFVGEKSRFPAAGKIFQGSKKGGGETINETKINFLTPLRDWEN